MYPTTSLEQFAVPLLPSPVKTIDCDRQTSKKRVGLTETRSKGKL